MSPKPSPDATDDPTTWTHPTYRVHLRDKLTGHAGVHEDTWTIPNADPKYDVVKDAEVDIELNWLETNDTDLFRGLALYGDCCPDGLDPYNSGRIEIERIEWDDGDPIAEAEWDSSR